MMEEETKTFDYAALAMNTSISMKGLTVNSVYTTESGDSTGAMTLSCVAEDVTHIDIRTDVLLDESGALITADRFKDKTIDVKGFVDCFDGEYQIEVYSIGDVVFHN